MRPDKFRLRTPYRYINERSILAAFTGSFVLEVTCVGKPQTAKRDVVRAHIFQVGVTRQASGNKHSIQIRYT